MESLITPDQDEMCEARIDQHKKNLAAIEVEFRRSGHPFYAYLVGLSVAAISRFEDHGPGKKRRHERKVTS